MKSILVSICILFICNSFAYSKCIVNGDFRGVVIEDGIFLGKIKFFTIIGYIYEDSFYEMPKSFDESIINVSINEYGETICKLPKKQISYIGVDDNGDKFYIHPNSIHVKCRCY